MALRSDLRHYPFSDSGVDVADRCGTPHHCRAGRAAIYGLSAQLSHGQCVRAHPRPSGNAYLGGRITDSTIPQEATKPASTTVGRAAMVHSSNQIRSSASTLIEGKAGNVYHIPILRLSSVEIGSLPSCTQRTGTRGKILSPKVEVAIGRSPRLRRPPLKAVPVADCHDGSIARSVHNDHANQNLILLY